ncbi:MULTISPECIES: SatD family protein [Dermabacter]|uniref:SatD family protein n=1 Tax=Dermabacter TaxID=36739 RepID=UPI000353F569|nr:MULTISPECIES: SatD family protein [Dermabacter]EPH14773.1 hypothetical protein HMPREF1484_02085 [Dermabacter sp. HFH0086]MCT1807496.1 SatD family protein [Dermabacter hominis]
MAPVKDQAYAVAVIGDIVNSRDHNRTALHEHLTSALNAIQTPSHERLHPTVGDEIQGVFATHGDALRATHILRLHLREHDIDIRFGIGAGEIRIIDEGAGIQDGSAWWAAREALERTEELAQTSGFSGIRTGLSAATSENTKSDGRRATVGTQAPQGHDTPPPEALCHLIDAHVSALKGGACGSLRGILEGESNGDTAARLGISPSANTQRIMRNDLRPLAEAMRATWLSNAPATRPER